MTDERLLTVAKLAEQIRGDLDGLQDLHDHAGLISDEQDRAVLSFLEGADLDLSDLEGNPAQFHSSQLGKIIGSTFSTSEATDAVHNSNESVISHLVGVTEQDLSGSALRLPMMILDQLHNNDAPAFITGFGNPNSGKTNSMSLFSELRSYDLDDDLLILSNVRSWPLTDIIVTSMHDLMVALLEHRDRPKFIFIDEASTHFDARTYRREVAQQWTPAAKRFAKVNVDCCGLVVHTGKDLHPEAKRLTTLAYFKSDKKTAEFYSNWPADADFPSDRLFGGDIIDLEPTSAEADPNDAAPWSWNLRPELFALDLDWPDLLDELRQRGPSES
jgi:hypothetical protein